jgi:hypothetical protein
VIFDTKKSSCISGMLFRIETLPEFTISYFFSSTLASDVCGFLNDSNSSVFYGIADSYAGLFSVNACKFLVGVSIGSAGSSGTSFTSYV